MVSSNPEDMLELGCNVSEECPDIMVLIFEQRKFCSFVYVTCEYQDASTLTVLENT
jgi:hypothetical protein